MTLRELWWRITSTRYTRALEAELAHAHSENALLRAENRALLNSILGIAGVPPIVVPQALPGESPVTEAWNAPARAGASGGAGNGAGQRIAMPMRRRSWQQINRMLEYESGVKKREE
jgi:hypothetical protein